MTDILLEAELILMAAIMLENARIVSGVQKHPQDDTLHLASTPF